jgi:hypothetical protein
VSPFTNSKKRDESDRMNTTVRKPARKRRPVVVVPVKKKNCFAPCVGSAVGIQIDGDSVCPAPQSLGMPLDHAQGQRLAHAIQFLDSDRILETRRFWLRWQVAAHYGIAIEKQLMNGVAGQSGRVAGVRVATGNREHALCD